jgi:hypothetical protein
MEFDNIPITFDYKNKTSADALLPGKQLPRFPIKKEASHNINKPNILVYNSTTFYS